MDKKIDKVLNVFKNGDKKSIYLRIILTTVITISLIVSMVVTGVLQDLFYYPEKEYILLETEVHRMAREKDFSTEYECYITQNNINNLKTVEISKESATLIAQIDEKGEILFINREVHVFQHFVLLTAAFGISIGFAVTAIYYSIYFILFITKGICKMFSKKVKDK